jgi:hypothetical protein
VSPKRNGVRTCGPRLYFSNYLSVVRRDHPKLAKLRTQAGFRRAHHIIVMASDVGHAAHHVAQHALEAEILPERVLLRLSSFIAAAIVASRTDGVATVPENVAMHLAEQLGLATFKPSIPLPPFEIAQYWHERCHRDPGHRWLRAASFDPLLNPVRYLQAEIVRPGVAGDPLGLLAVRCVNCRCEAGISYKIAEWRAAADEDGHYSFAVPL